MAFPVPGCFFLNLSPKKRSVSDFLQNFLHRFAYGLLSVIGSEQRVNNL